MFACNRFKQDRLLGKIIFRLVGGFEKNTDIFFRQRLYVFFIIWKKNTVFYLQALLLVIGTRQFYFVIVRHEDSKENKLGDCT
jgi:hypothetical protein